MLTMIPLPAVVRAALGSSDAQIADAAGRLMAACESNADRAALVARARKMLAELESSW